MEPQNMLHNRISTLSLQSNLCKGDFVGRKVLGLNRPPRKCSVIVLDGIDIKPHKPTSTILNLKQSFLFPPNYRNMIQTSAEHGTQTSLTKLNDIDKERSSQSSVSSVGDESAPQNSTNVKKKRLITPKRTYRHGAWYIRPQSGKQMGKKCVGVRKTKVSVNTLQAPFENPILSEEDLQGDQENLSMTIDDRIEAVIEALHDHNWEANLHALRILGELCPSTWKNQDRFLTTIYRRFIELLKSPRSSIVRVTCQAAGELFRAARCFKRAEFDEIVSLILCKTADPNRFIQKDANIALDKMVTYIPFMHAIRAISVLGPTHKNSVVRTATARLFVCACALSKADAVLGAEANPRTRKRILTALSTFLLDKCCDVRGFGERLYKMLRKHKFFNDYFFKDMDCSLRAQFKKMFASLDGK